MIKISIQVLRLIHQIYFGEHLLWGESLGYLEHRSKEPIHVSHVYRGNTLCAVITKRINQWLHLLVEILIKVLLLHVTICLHKFYTPFCPIPHKFGFGPPSAFPSLRYPSCRTSFSFYPTPSSTCWSWRSSRSGKDDLVCPIPWSTPSTRYPTTRVSLRCLLYNLIKYLGCISFWPLWNLQRIYMPYLLDSLQPSVKNPPNSYASHRILSPSSRFELSVLFLYT